ncbi:MAG: hypothetical protein Q4A64_03370 [Porphyromonadaceae bacterium]|nr:hypothetical protein [Porphyromonadaceae bacterium]
MSINLRPHVLSYRVASNGHKGDDGFYRKGVERWEGEIPCHARPSGKANEITYPDGSTKRYSYVVYYDTSYRDFALGDRVRIALGDGGTRNLEVLGFFRYQTHCKLWV